MGCLALFFVDDSSLAIPRVTDGTLGNELWGRMQREGYDGHHYLNKFHHRHQTAKARLGLPCAVTPEWDMAASDLGNREITVVFDARLCHR
jgi:hypothetical protein